MLPIVLLGLDWFHGENLHGFKVKVIGILQFLPHEFFY